jgi:hypothetical protein
MKRQTQTKERQNMKADALIKHAQSRRVVVAPPSAKALRELKAVLEYNDTAPSMRLRVSAEDAVKLLRAHGWAGTARRALDSVCRSHFGRRSYGSL